MEKEFVPYEQASALKKLGFDEPCVAYYKYNILKEKGWEYTDSQNKVNYIFGINNDAILAPLYQQAFDWFRGNYGYFPSFDYNHGDSVKNRGFFYCIVNIKDKDFYFDTEDKKGNVTLFKTYEEAQTDCLNKLTEIAQKKK